MADKDVDPVAVTHAAAAAVQTLTDGGARARQRPPGPEEDLTGRQLAHFRVEKRLGKGGMGEVYLATDLALERRVALKLLAPEIAADRVARERFIREARAQARLTHPNICHIYFIGEQDGRLFFAMEYVDGESLQERLERKGAVPLEEAVELCLMAAAGLSDAQRHGFTHRDVKPSNLLVDAHGVVKVADFGLVKDARAGDGDAEVVGTPLYMSPELARGDDADHRADIYALGVTLHQLVSGKPPFSGATPMAVVSKHQFEPRPRLEASGGRAALVDELCERMMAKKVEDRPATYAEVVAALEDLSPRVTRPAGFWVRSVAQALDFLMVGSLAGIASGVLELPGNLALAVAFAAFYIVALAVWGKTPGKAALEIEVVDLHGAGARRRGLGLRRAGVRFLAQFGVAYLCFAASELVEVLRSGPSPLWTVASVVLGVGIVAVPLSLGLAALKRAGKRTIWDRAAGTRVVYRRHRT